MAAKFPQFTLRIPQKQLDKLHYIAEYNARSCNRELELLIRLHINTFEKEHGEISEEDIKGMNK